VNVEEINQLRDGLYELIALSHPVPHADALLTGLSPERIDELGGVREDSGAATVT
jgi:hypothetical protein